MSNHIDSMLRTVYDNWKVSRPKDGTRTSIDIDGLFKDIMAEEQLENIRVATGQIPHAPDFPVKPKQAPHCHKLICSKCMFEELIPTNRLGVRLDPGCWLCANCNAITYFNYAEL